MEELLEEKGLGDGEEESERLKVLVRLTQGLTEEHEVLIANVYLAMDGMEGLPNFESILDSQEYTTLMVPKIQERLGTLAVFFDIRDKKTKTGLAMEKYFVSLYLKNQSLPDSYKLLEIPARLARFDSLRVGHGPNGVGRIKAYWQILDGKDLVFTHPSLEDHLEMVKSLGKDIDVPEADLNTMFEPGVFDDEAIRQLAAANGRGEEDLLKLSKGLRLLQLEGTAHENLIRRFVAESGLSNDPEEMRKTLEEFPDDAFLDTRVGLCLLTSYDSVPLLADEKRTLVERHLASVAARTQDPELKRKLYTWAAVLAHRTNKKLQDCDSYCRFLEYTEQLPESETQEAVSTMRLRNEGSCHCD